MTGFSASQFIQRPNPDEVVFWGIRLRKDPSCDYRHDYWSIADKLLAKNDDVGYTLNTLRKLFRRDLWFLEYFGMRVSIANHPFWVQQCYTVENGQNSHTLDVWAREHGKSTIITIGDTIRRVLNNAEERICIFSYSLDAAKYFVRTIKFILEESSILRFAFPDILWESPKTDAPSWGEESGLVVQRTGFYKEPTIRAAGLLEGMPTGSHFTGRVYDDIETFDTAQSPDMTFKLKAAFDMSNKLSAVTDEHESGWQRIIGTPYSHDGLLTYCEEKKLPNGFPMYRTRKLPATVGGMVNGESIYLPEKKLDEERTNIKQFYMQYLVNPTPPGVQKLKADKLVEVFSPEVPQNLFKFMAIDPAAYAKKSNKPDSWGIVVGGIEPYRDNVGASNVYILDLAIEPFDHEEAMKTITEMYLRNPGILQVGVEKVGAMTFEVHISKFLAAHGVDVTQDGDTLKVMHPGGRQKADRIESALVWPLNNSKIFIANTVPNTYKERLKQEMEKFPLWHDDGLDALAYLYDMFKDYNFSTRDFVGLDEVGRRAKMRSWGDDDESGGTPNGWMIQ